MTTDLERYKKRMGLVQISDPEVEKPVFRRDGFDGVKPFADIDGRLGYYLRRKRTDRQLSRTDLASLLGLSMQVYGRYERAFSKLHVTRLIHLCEILGFLPIEMLYEAAPHLWGKTPEEAKNRVALLRMVARLPPDTTADLLRVVEHLQCAEDAMKHDDEPAVQPDRHSDSAKAAGKRRAGTVNGPD